MSVNPGSSNYMTVTLQQQHAQQLQQHQYAYQPQQYAQPQAAPQPYPQNHIWVPYNPSQQTFASASATTINPAAVRAAHSAAAPVITQAQSAPANRSSSAAASAAHSAAAPVITQAQSALANRSSSAAVAASQPANPVEEQMTITKAKVTKDEVTLSITLRRPGLSGLTDKVLAQIFAQTVLSSLSAEAGRKVEAPARVEQDDITWQQADKNLNHCENVAEEANKKYDTLLICVKSIEQQLQRLGFGSDEYNAVARALLDMQTDVHVALMNCGVADEKFHHAKTELERVKKRDELRNQIKSLNKKLEVIYESDRKSSAITLENMQKNQKALLDESTYKLKVAENNYKLSKEAAQKANPDGQYAPEAAYYQESGYDGSSADYEPADFYEGYYDQQSGQWISPVPEWETDEKDQMETKLNARAAVVVSRQGATSSSSSSSVSAARVAAPASAAAAAASLASASTTQPKAPVVEVDRALLTAKDVLNFPQGHQTDCWLRQFYSNKASAQAVLSICTQMLQTGHPRYVVDGYIVDSQDLIFYCAMARLNQGEIELADKDIIKLKNRINPRPAVKERVEEYEKLKKELSNKEKSSNKGKEIAAPSPSSTGAANPVAAAAAAASESVKPAPLTPVTMAGASPAKLHLTLVLESASPARVAAPASAALTGAANPVAAAAAASESVKPAPLTPTTMQEPAQLHLTLVPDEVNSIEVVPAEDC